MQNWIRQKIKSRDGFATKLLYRAAMFVRYGTVPAIPGLHNHLDKLHCSIAARTMQLTQLAWNTPQFSAKLKSPPNNLRLVDGQPTVTGNVTIEIGRSVAMSGTINIIATHDQEAPAELCIGNRASIAEDVVITLGRSVVIADHTIISPEVRILADESKETTRIMKTIPTRDQPQIFIDENVWIAYGATVSGNVRIGTGTVVATGSVVTQDLPANVLAAGNPARPVRDLRTGMPIHV